MVFIESKIFEKLREKYFDGVKVLLRRLKMGKRDLFEELKQGLEDVRGFEQEKLTLKTTIIEPKEKIVLEADDIRAIRDKYNMSRALFANFLHISTRTLEKWELGTSKPNQQATTLLALTDKYPDMFERLKTL